MEKCSVNFFNKCHVGIWKIFWGKLSHLRSNIVDIFIRCMGIELKMKFLFSVFSIELKIIVVKYLLSIWLLFELTTKIVCGRCFVETFLFLFLFFDLFEFNLYFFQLIQFSMIHMVIFFNVMIELLNFLLQSMTKFTESLNFMKVIFDLLLNRTFSGWF